jgi:hypothetical protein
LAGIVKIWSSSYWDYWFGENEIARVNIVPQSLFIVSVLLMASLGVLLGLPGILVGAAALVLVYTLIVKTAKKRRSVLEGKTIEELTERKIANQLVRYSEVSSAELRSGQLTIFYRQRKIRLKVLPGDLPQIESLLRTKLGEKLKVAAT